MPLKTIYSPDGQMFEVHDERAALLILNEGWTQAKPVITPGTAGDETKKKKTRKRTSTVSSGSFSTNTQP